MHIDRTEAARCLAKAIAYDRCDKHEEANEWAVRLVMLLNRSEILSAASINRFTKGGG